MTAATQSWAAQASILDVGDPRIDALLHHSESAYVFTGASSIIRWAGVEKDDRLVAVAGQEVEASGAAHLVSVCSDPDHRGMGYARAVCSRLVVDAALDGCPVTILEMYAANEAGRALYSSLGFTEAHRYQSGLLSPRASVAVNAP
jgi:predicted GNAT family acetyltransferase